MEKKTLIAIVFAILFIVAWDKFVIKKYYPRSEVTSVKESVDTRNENPKNITGNVVQEIEKKEENVKAGNAEEIENIIAATKVVPLQTYVLENDYVSLTFSNTGAVLTSAVLKQYRDNSNRFYELVNQKMKDLGYNIFNLDGSKQILSLNNVNFECNEDGNMLTFTTQFNGNTVEKKYTLENGYFLKVTIAGLNDNYTISIGPGINGSEKVASRYDINDQIVLLIDGDVERYKKKKIEKEPVTSDAAQWGAVENKYFAKILECDGSPVYSSGLVSYKDGEETYKLVDLKVSQSSEFSGSLFMGPKKYELLKEEGRDLVKVVNFGFFGMFAKWLFLMLRYINQFIMNYGWSIIILTVFIRILIFPLNQMSMKSMKRMQELQPKIKEIQKKYSKYGKDNTMKMKMNQEIADMYKKEGVNPAGGCLPVVLQIPVFFAYWGVLSNLIDLRNAEFMFWITDLSAPDSIYVLPILMGLTQFISQLITPMSGDKTQQRMMYFMPIVITFMLAKAPSGLILYWTTNNVFQIFQQLYINYGTRKAEKEMK